VAEKGGVSSRKMAKGTLLAKVRCPYYATTFNAQKRTGFCMHFGGMDTTGQPTRGDQKQSRTRGTSQVETTDLSPWGREVVTEEREKRDKTPK